MWKIENAIYGSMCGTFKMQNAIYGSMWKLKMQMQFSVQYGKLKMQNAIYGSIWKIENAKCNLGFNVEN